MHLPRRRSELRDPQRDASYHHAKHAREHATYTRNATHAMDPDQGRRGRRGRRSLQDVESREEHGDVVVEDERTPLVSQPYAAGADDGRAKLILRGLVGLLFVLFAILVVLLVLVPAQPSPATPPLNSHGRLNAAHLARGSRGAVAAENGVCSDIGVDLMRKGGGAADAAIGAALCVGTLNMFSSGIGGGGFALIRAPLGGNASAAEAEHVTVDFRETAPSGAFEDMFHHRPEAAQVGGLSVAVPGELRGLEEIWRRWGKLEWRQLVEPSVALAKEARVGRELARRLAFFGSFLPDKPEWREMFQNPETGAWKKEGDVIRRPAYARTLQAVADHGSRVFYEGEIARAIVSHVQSTGGIMTLDDLREYAVEIRPAVRGLWTRGRRAWTTPMPTSGTVLLQMMNVLRLLGLERRPEIPANDTDARIANDGLWAHYLVEAMKHGSAARTRLGDPAFLNTTSLLEAARIPTLTRAKSILPRIDDDRTHPLEYYNPLFDIPEDHGTTHVSATDESGVTVGITTTVNLLFGSREMDPVTGVILNDEMDDTSTPGEPNAFGLRPSPFNYPQPRKRPLSSVSPILIEDEEGRFELLLGAAGGSRIPSSVLQALLHLDDHTAAANLSGAIEAPRLHHQLLPGEVFAETSVVDGEVEKGIREQLVERGHRVTEMDVNFGFAQVQGVQAVRGGGGALVELRAASDSRKNGWAAAW